MQRIFRTFSPFQAVEFDFFIQTCAKLIVNIIIDNNQMYVTEEIL